MSVHLWSHTDGHTLTHRHGHMMTRVMWCVRTYVLVYSVCMNEMAQGVSREYTILNECTWKTIFLQTMVERTYSNPLFRFPRLSSLSLFHLNVYTYIVQYSCSPTTLVSLWWCVYVWSTRMVVSINPWHIHDHIIITRHTPHWILKVCIYVHKIYIIV